MNASEMKKGIGFLQEQLIGLKSIRSIPEREKSALSLLDSIDALQTALDEESQAIQTMKSSVQKILSDARQQKPGIGENSALPAFPHLVGHLANALGGLNLLIHQVKLTAISAPLRGIAADLIEQTEGLLPSAFTLDDFKGDRGPETRVVVRWEVQRPLRIEDVEGIFQAVAKCYEQQISGRDERCTRWDSSVRYRNQRGSAVAGKNGIYFGPDSYYSHLSRGVVVARKFKLQSGADFLARKWPYDWLARTTAGEQNKTFEVELREGGDNALRQDSFLFLVVQLGFFLQYSSFLNWRSLAVKTFRALNKVGTELGEALKPYGLQEVISTIERVVLLPLQQPAAAAMYGLRPESILLAGVPGTGKTLLAHHLMLQECNAIFVSVGSDDLLFEIIKGENSNMLLQIDRIGSLTGLPVVLLVDDIDIVTAAQKDDQQEVVVSKLLNMLQGIRQKGFFLIAATNHPYRIDSRLLQPGRFSKVVHVPLPDLPARTAMLAHYLNKLPFKGEEERSGVINAMARETEGWSGRYIYELSVEASRLCVLETLGGDIFSADTPPREPLELRFFRQAKTKLLEATDINALVRGDKEIQKFVSQRPGKLGFSV